jgi:hypothetical protein
MQHTPTFQPEETPCIELVKSEWYGWHNHNLMGAQSICAFYRCLFWTEINVRIIWNWDLYTIGYSDYDVFLESDKGSLI